MPMTLDRRNLAGLAIGIICFVAYKTSVFGLLSTELSTSDLRACGEMTAKDYQRSCLGKEVRFTGIVDVVPKEPHELWIKLGDKELRGFDLTLKETNAGLVSGMVIDFRGIIGQQNTFRPDIVDVAIVNTVRGREAVDAETQRIKSQTAAAERRKILTQTNLDRIKKWGVSEDKFIEAHNKIRDLGYYCRGAAEAKLKSPSRPKSLGQGPILDWSMTADGRILAAGNNLEVEADRGSYRGVAYVCVFRDASARNPESVDIQ